MLVRATVTIVLKVEHKRLSEFLNDWESTRSNLAELAEVESASITNMPDEFDLPIR